MQRRYPTTLAALMLLTAACSGSDESSTATSDAPDSSAEAVTEATADDEAAVSTEPTETAPPSTPAPTTTAAPTTTTTAAPRPVTITGAAIDAGLDIRGLNDANDLTTLPGDTITAVIAGDASAARGERSRATIWRTNTGVSWQEVPLDDAGALESTAYGIAGSGDRVAAIGVVAIDGQHQAAVWRSDDRGATFGAPEFPIGEPSLGAHGTFVGDELVAVSWRVTDDGHQLVASSATPDGWRNADLPSIGRVPVVSGVTSSDAVVIVTGRVDIAGRNTGAAWRSTDGGATFEAIDDPAISASSRIGAPSVGGDGFVATASRPNNGATVLVTSTDGTVWREIPLALRRGERSWTGTNGGAGPVMVVDGGYVIGMTNQLSAVAVVDGDGVGSYDLAPYNRAARFSGAQPFLLSDGLHVVGNSATSFMTARQQTGNWTNVGQPGQAATGPTPWSLELTELSSGPVAEANSWPLVEPADTGGITWSNVFRFLEWEGTSWVEQDGYPDAFILVTDGERDIAFVTVDDPNDDDLAGPLGGTGVSELTSDGWSEPELVLGGPGGDSLVAGVAIETGFVGVGSRRVRDASGATTSSIVIMEELDGVWTEQAAPGDFGDQARLSGLHRGGDGSLLATGHLVEDDAWQPLLLRRDAEDWRRVALPTDDVSVQIYATVPTPSGVDLITNESSTWIRHEAQPDGSYVATTIQLPNPVRDFPSAVVEIDGRVFAIGLTSVVAYRTVAVWELLPDGSAVALETESAPTGVSLSIDDTIVSDGRILVGGVHNDQHVVWEIDLGDQ